MPRLARSFIPAIFFSLSLVFSGCKTVYSDMYSPRRNHYIALKEPPKKTEPIAALTEPEPALPPDVNLPPAPPPSAPAPVEPAMPADPAVPEMAPAL